MRASAKSDDTIEHKNKVIDALTAELTQKVGQHQAYLLRLCIIETHVVNSL
jgi:hypothetical protein